MIVTALWAVAAAGDRIVVRKASSGPDYGPFEGTAGALVTVEGDGFDANPDNVKVALDGTTCYVSAAITTRVTFALPDAAKLGKHQVTIAAGGRSASFALEVVPRSTRKEGVPPASTIIIHRFDVLDDPPRFTVTGETALADKTELVVELGFKFPRGKFTSEQSLASRQTSVADHTFRIEFGPFRDRKLLAGEYRVSVRAGDEEAKRYAPVGDDRAHADAEAELIAHGTEVAREAERLVRAPDAAALRDLVRSHGRRKNVTLGDADPEAERLEDGLILGAVDVATKKLALDPKELGAFDGWARALTKAEIGPALERLRSRLVK